jgi:xylan 1,4-beta-xylosidase
VSRATNIVVVRPIVSNSSPVTHLFLLVALFPLVAIAGFAQQPVSIRVNATQKLGSLKPVWNYFGYDEPNYTTQPNGRKLIAELAALSSTPVYIRTHNLLTTGDGTPALKWGSTNAYTEDAAGNPIYDWTIVDGILDTYVRAQAKPFVEIGFMPKALSIHPEPYQHTWPQGGIDTGWAYPPKDYQRWGELVRQWAAHCLARYGRDEVESWYWEVWNEPDISYWHGSPEDYDQLYDYAAEAVKKVLPGARVGGPATTGPASAGGANFLRQFLAHCARGKNYATGREGAPLDFISFHAKGRPEVAEGRVRMGLARHLQDVDKGLQVIAEFPEFQNRPIVLTESDPEGCAACSAKGNPQNAYRNGPLYPAYTALALSSILKLADRRHADIEGVLTWAFEFENQPYFEGFRTLATNGVDKPILNLFRMLGLMAGERVSVESSGAVGQDSILGQGVRGQSDVDALAAASLHEVSVLVWNYQDDDMAGVDAPIHLTLAGLPRGGRVLLHHYRIDRDHSNSYSLWKQMGSPSTPTPVQYEQLQAAGQLEMLESPRWLTTHGDGLEIDFGLPSQGVSLVVLSW